jgi:lipoprotein Spr
MRNIFKIALLLIVCSSSYASNTINSAVLNKINPPVTADSALITDPNPTKKKDTRKRTIINDKNANDIIIEDNNDSYLAEQLINVASDNLGSTYRGGGITKNGFDCSGLMYSTFKNFDITLPRSSYQMAEVGTPINLEDAKKGDLIFFINRGQKRINHVGMIVEVTGDDVKFIHSSTQSGVIISSLKEAYYDRTFKQINRVIQ